MRIILIGASGSGRTTQLKRLSYHYHLPVLSMSEILRQEIAANTPLGKTAADFMAKGALVPDELIISWMQNHLLQPQFSQGWLLEGYPRTAFQAEELDFLLSDLLLPLTRVIYLKVSPDLLMERSIQRGLPDDTPEMIGKRIEQFFACTMPLLEYYHYQNLLTVVDGTLDTDEVNQKIQEVIAGIKQGKP
ncbi:MAG: adenylate kinase family protein [Pseudanabaenaceae cyanobacterium]|jgi:adenylate kinase